jgi:Fe-Mn family superoxide dismutase
LRLTLPELRYDRDTLEPYYLRGAIDSHWSHHAECVANANRLLARLDAARRSGESGNFVEVERALDACLAEHALHSVFWQSISADLTAPSRALSAAVTRYIGSIDRLVDEVAAAALALGEQGWVVVAWDVHARLMRIQQLPGNDIGRYGTVPLLALDMWAHAYDVQYGDRRADWVDAFVRLIDWRNVERRLADAFRLGDLLL